MEDVSKVVVALNLSAEGSEEFVCHAYEQHRAAIYRHMIAIGLDPNSAQDLTQEAFLSLFESLSKGQRIQHLRSWLFSVASRLAVRLLEKRRGEALVSVPDMAI